MIPPWLRLLERLCLGPDDREAIGGDLREDFLRGHRQSRRASLRYARDLISASRRQTRGRLRLWQDVMYAGRRLSRTPGLTVASVLTLAVGIGTTLAIYGVADAVLLRPLPYPDAQRLLFVSSSFPGASGGGDQVSILDIDEMRARSRSITRIAAYQTGRALAFRQSAGDPQRVFATFADPEYLALLGARPAVGRLLDARDHTAPNAHPVVVLTHRFWRDRLGSDPAVLGGTLHFSDVALTVVGILDPAFADLLSNEGDVFDTDIFVPLMMVPTFSGPNMLTERGARNFWALAQLADYATVEDASTELRAIGETLAAEHTANQGFTFWVDGLQQRLTRDIRGAILLLGAGSTLVLLLAIANVAHLLFARVTSRATEIGVRRALGARTSQIVSLVTTEAVVLGALGGIAGVALAWSAQAALTSLMPVELLPRLSGVRHGISFFMLAALLALAIGCALGIATSAIAVRATVGAVGEPRGGVSVRGSQSRRLLIAGEVVMALVLLVQSHLMIASLSRLRADGLGFNTERLLTVQMDLRGDRYEEHDAAIQFAIDISRELSAIPGAESAFLWGPGRPGRNTWVTFPGREDATPQSERMMAWRHTITPGALRASGIPLRRGREFTADDRLDTTRVVVVSETLADILWPGEDPIGKRIKWRTDRIDSPLLTVVGLAADAKHRGRLAGREHSARDLYVAHAQMADRSLVALVRARNDPATLVSAVRDVVRRLDPGLPLFNISTLDGWLAEEEAETRFAALLISAFGLAALALAAIGIYGVLNYSVSLRQRELAVRIALGAARRDIVRTTLTESLRPVAIGVIIGAPAALLMARWMQSLLFGVEPTDPLAVTVAALILVGVAIAASLLPARRASRQDPIAALR